MSRSPPRRATRRRQHRGVRQVLDDAEVLGAADAATAGDDDRRLGELRAIAGLSRARAGDLRGVLGLRGHLDGDDLTGAVGGLGLDRTGADGDHRGVAGGSASTV